MASFDRLAFLASALPELGVAPPPDLARPDPSDDERKMLDALCAEAARGRSRFDELRALGARELMSSSLTAEVARRIDRDAPETIALPGRARVRVAYPRGQPPFVASRMQDFFGLRDGPKLAGGRVALTLHLLAPNQRAVQVTQDLAGFWQRHYPALRRELSRRYPRHRWPEDPLAVIP
jgi:ATP-dependent helicase HrpB